MDDFLWNNPHFQGMDPIKLQFLMNFSQKDKPKTMKDAMPFLLANMNLAKKEKIQFSSDEIHLITDFLCQSLSPEEQTKVKRIMAMLDR